jgi:uncharacterized protein
MDLFAIFLTGLTTGGLTCLAVQGGLLATALTRQVAVPAANQSEHRNSKRPSLQPSVTAVQLAKDPLPVFSFLVAKLFAYTVLGFLLGLLGSVAQIAPAAQGLMQLFAGVFMVGTALNMFNVHPIFRFFALQPPKAITRLVRDQAKSQTMFAPALLGLMTVLIPCGTTQAMEIVAISSGSPLSGALIMFAFILGTLPTFMILGFLATTLRSKFNQALALTAALLILFLGLVSVDGGLNVLGSPLAPSRVISAFLSPRGFNTPVGDPVPAQVVNGVQELTINAAPTSYTPNYLSVKSGQPIIVRLKTNENYGCTRAFTIPSLGIREILPETGERVISLPPQSAGQILFTCSMGMYSGTILVS